LKNKWRIYLKPFDSDGNYTDWVEVTDDIILDSLGSVNSDIDNTEYDIGVNRFSNFNITFRNDSGKYSDVGEDKSIFRYKRSDSLLKITWEIENGGPYVGIATSGSGYLSEEIEIFQGLLNDESLKMDIKKQELTFTCLGREAIFQRTIVPFDTVDNGDLYSETLYKILNQSAITNLLTLDDANIDCGLDQTIDSIASLQNKTVQEGLNKLLLASNSVLYIENGTIFISPREPGVSVAFTFYGQGSQAGPENIVDLKNIQGGLNKTFNFFTWKDTALVSQDPSSVSKYGARKKEVSFEFTTDETKQQNILDSLKDEFKNPQQEFNITTPLSYQSLAVNLLDRVAIDYPRVYVSTGKQIPICGVAICGDPETATLPKGLWAFTVSDDDGYKVLGKSIDMKNENITFRVRKIET
jgi:hypothetical protein